MRKSIVPNLLVSCEELLRSSLARGGLELPIFDSRLTIDRPVILSPPCFSAGEGSPQLLFGLSRLDELQRCFAALSMTVIRLVASIQIALAGSIDNRQSPIANENHDPVLL
jgi:hypothetical protein